MNSFNHYSYGSVGRFLYERVAGLQGVEPGFTAVRFAPCVDGRLGWCEAAYDSVAGRWESSWRIEKDGRVTVSLLVPDGCTAEVMLPFCSEGSINVRSGSFEYTYQPELDFRARYNPDSLLRELADDPEASVIVAKLAPSLTNMMSLGDREIGAATLRQLVFMPQFGLSMEQVQELISALSTLQY